MFRNLNFFNNCIDFFLAPSENVILIAAGVGHDNLLLFLLDRLLLLLDLGGGDFGGRCFLFSFLGWSHLTVLILLLDILSSIFFFALGLVRLILKVLL